MTKRYEFTGETKTLFGRTLHQIRAMVAMPPIGVEIGNVGGWIESESNLPHDGTAWVFPDAQACGKAIFRGGKFRGGTETRLQPLFLAGLTWSVTITDSHMTIGCQTHSIAQWNGFDDHRIADMDGRDALKFWRAHKAMIMGLCEATGRAVSVD